jgi:hypothetical protein
LQQTLDEEGETDKTLEIGRTDQCFGGASQRQNCQKRPKVFWQIADLESGEAVGL